MTEEPPMAWRMRTAEARLNAIDAGFATQARSIAAHDEQQARIETKVEAHESAITSISAKLDKVYWALIGLSLTIAGSAAATIMTMGHTP